MTRARFKANPDDFRPVEWPVKHPYWCTGYGGFDSPESDPRFSTIVAYADDEAEIKRNWPEAEDIEAVDVDGYVFTDRFPKPSWFALPNEAA